jgi:leader peptidase (prepilin peptidase)/N-methyltransferase
MIEMFYPVIIFVFGAIAGSFLNVCIHRMPRELSIVWPGSFCPKCKIPIPWYENIPLLSYLILRGKCFRCRRPISFRYFFVELLNAVSWLLIWRSYGLSAAFAIAAVFVSMMIVVTLTDLETGFIPHGVTWTGMIFGVCVSVVNARLVPQGLWYHKLLASVLGLVTGAATIFAVAELGKLLFGKRKVRLAPGTVITIKDNRLLIDQPGAPLASRAGGVSGFFQRLADTLTRGQYLDPSCSSIAWDDIFNRSSDRIVFRAATLRFAGGNFKDVEVEISEKSFRVAGKEHALADAGVIEGRAEAMVLSREAMGFGDLCLMAMIGTFLGPWLTVLVFMFAPFIALPYALFCRFAKKQETIPYGPFLAVMAVIFYFAGPEILDLFSTLYGV